MDNKLKVKISFTYFDDLSDDDCFLHIYYNVNVFDFYELLCTIANAEYDDDHDVWRLVEKLEQEPTSFCFHVYCDDDVDFVEFLVYRVVKQLVIEESQLAPFPTDASLFSIVVCRGEFCHDGE